MDGESTRFFGGNTAVMRRTPVFVLVLYRKLYMSLCLIPIKYLVMGHKREDYDALGGIIGVVAIARPW